MPADGIERGDQERCAALAGGLAGNAPAAGGEGRDAVVQAGQTSAGTHLASARQIRLALLRMGLLDQVEAVLAGMPGPAGRAARIQFEYATEVPRYHPLVAVVGASIGLSAEGVDAVFRAASEE